MSSLAHTHTCSWRSYLRQEDAARAIEAMNGKGHDYLILSVEWAKYVLAEMVPSAVAM